MVSINFKWMSIQLNILLVLKTISRFPPPSKAGGLKAIRRFS